MKLFIKMFYVFILIMIGVNIYGNAVIEKEQTFFINETVESINNNDKDLYLNNTMVSLGAKSFINKPVYRFISEDDLNSFELEVYHFMIEENKEKNYGLAFYLNDINLKSELKTLDIGFYSNFANKFIEEEVGFQFNEKTLKSNLIYSLLIDDKFNSFEGVSISEISNIEIKQNGNSVLKIDHNDNFELKENNETILNNDNKYLYSNEFNGSVSTYKSLIDEYNKDTIKKVDYTKFDSYQNIVNKNVINYTIVAIIGSALVFFMEPLIKFIKGFSKKNKETTKND